MLWMYYYKKKDCTAVNLNFLQYVKHEIQKSSSFFLNSKKIKENVLCNVDKRFILIHPAGGAHQLSGILGVYYSFKANSVSKHFFIAGSTQTAKEPVDHLYGTENHLQAACGQQSAKKSKVKLHNVLGLCA